MVAHACYLSTQEVETASGNNANFRFIGNTEPGLHEALSESTKEFNRSLIPFEISCRVRDRDLVLFFYMLISSFPSTIC